MKDWVKNIKSSFVRLLTSSYREKEKNDYYSIDPNV